MRVLVGEGGQRGKVGAGFMEGRLSQSWRARWTPREGTDSCTGNVALASEPEKPNLPNPCDLGHLSVAGTGPRKRGEGGGRMAWHQKRGPHAGAEGTP